MKGTVYVLKCWHRLNKKMKKECVGLYIEHERIKCHILPHQLYCIGNYGLIFYIFAILILLRVYSLMCRYFFYVNI